MGAVSLLLAAFVTPTPVAAEAQAPGAATVSPDAAAVPAPEAAATAQPEAAAADKADAAAPPAPEAAETAQPNGAAPPAPEAAANTPPDAVAAEKPDAAAPATPEAAEAPPHPQLEFAPFNDKEFVAARKSGTPVVLYFEADWCAPCRKMHASTLTAPAVIEAAAGIRLFRVDMTKPNAYLSLVEKSFQILGAPTLILFGPDGKETGRRFGFVGAEELVRMLGRSRKPAQST